MRRMLGSFSSQAVELPEDRSAFSIGKHHPFIIYRMGSPSDSGLSCLKKWLNSMVYRYNYMVNGCFHGVFIDITMVNGCFHGVINHSHHWGAPSCTLVASTKMWTTVKVDPHFRTENHGCCPHLLQFSPGCLTGYNLVTELFNGELRECHFVRNSG